MRRASTFWNSHQVIRVNRAVASEQLGAYLLGCDRQSGGASDADHLMR
jgi:hypothetical protein